MRATVTHNPWHTGLYVTNLSDKRANLTPFVLPSAFTTGGGSIQNNVYNLPRELGIKIGYSF